MKKIKYIFLTLFAVASITGCKYLDVDPELGLSDEDINTLRIGGLFHDIGKIGVPDSILLKDAKLTDDEYSEIKNHPTIGAHILSNATIFQDVLPIVKHHHERYDGKGYPGKLKGKDI